MRWVLLALWAFTAFVPGILLVEPLADVRLGGFPFGFWWAQQGAIVAFLLLTLANALWWDRIEGSARRSDPGPGRDGGDP